ncbi:hypothetical protein M5D96_013790 [Drosophila gunungcola]|uniref:Uncharacterized protein n=1 Tax=Drosophila gunungcola TaxID=103775 RepID=A0A9Q0BJ88_9MUSC|nr:hypothetical protein M5D96_013790 [Drosophila gunungcola]
MSARVTRAEARRRMAAENLAGSGPGQGRSEDRPVVRPPRTPRRIPRTRRRSEASSPEPTVSSDSDVVMVDDPTMEARRWRLRKAAGPKGSIPHGSEGRVHQDSADDDHAAEARQTEAIIAEYRRQHERRQREAARKEAIQRKEQDARAEWEAALRAAEEEERRIWGDPVLLKKVPPQAEGAPEVPLTPRYVAEPRERAADPAEEENQTPSPPPWIPARPPTPRYCPEWAEAASEEEQEERRQQEEQRQQEERRQQEQRRQQEEQRQQEERRQQERRQQEGPPGYARMDIPVAHVSHAIGSFEAEGRVWRQHTVTWTWPDGATVATEEEGAQVWEEPRGNSRDPRLWRTAVPGGPAGVVMPTRTPTPTPSPLASPEVVAAQQGRVEQEGLPAEDVVEKGPWVWPDPVAPPRPILKRQYSAPVVETRPAFMRQSSAPDPRRWREVVEVDWPEGIPDAPAVVAA